MKSQIVDKIQKLSQNKDVKLQKIVKELLLSIPIYESQNKDVKSLITSKLGSFKDTEVSELLISIETKYTIENIGVCEALEKIKKTVAYRRNKDLQHLVTAYDVELLAGVPEYRLVDSFVKNLSLHTKLSTAINETYQTISQNYDKNRAHQLVANAIYVLEQDPNVDLYQDVINQLNMAFNLPGSHVKGFVYQALRNKYDMHPILETLMKELKYINCMAQEKVNAILSKDGRIIVSKKLSPVLESRNGSKVFITGDTFYTLSGKKISKLTPQDLDLISQRNSDYSRFFDVCRAISTFSIQENKLISNDGMHEFVIEKVNEDRPGNFGIADKLNKLVGKEVKVNFGTEKKPKMATAKIYSANVHGRDNQDVHVIVDMTPEEAKKVGFAQRTQINYESIVDIDKLIKVNEDEDKILKSSWDTTYWLQQLKPELEKYPEKYAEAIKYLNDNPDLDKIDGKILRELISKAQNNTVNEAADEIELVKHDDGYIYTSGKDKFVIYPNGNQWILQINGQNKLKGTLEMMKAGIKDHLKGTNTSESFKFYVDGQYRGNNIKRIVETMELEGVNNSVIDAINTVLSNFDLIKYVSDVTTYAPDYKDITLDTVQNGNVIFVIINDAESGINDVVSGDTEEITNDIANDYDVDIKDDNKVNEEEDEETKNEGELLELQDQLAIVEENLQKIADLDQPTQEEEQVKEIKQKLELERETLIKKIAELKGESVDVGVL